MGRRPQTDIGGSRPIGAVVDGPVRRCGAGGAIPACIIGNLIMLVTGLVKPRADRVVLPLRLLVRQFPIASAPGQTEEGTPLLNRQLVGRNMFGRAAGQGEQGLYIRCFGEFEVFYDGEPIISFTKRSKELLAYLIDKAGAVCTSSDICDSIFRGSADSYIRVVKKDLIKVLSDIGEEDILIKGWGNLGINKSKVRCDYFDYLDGKPMALNRYKGAYMQQYPWAEATRFRLES